MSLIKEPAVYLPLAFLIAMGVFCVACGDDVADALAKDKDPVILWERVSPHCQEDNKCREIVRWVTTSGRRHSGHRECNRYLNDVFLEEGAREAPHLKVLDAGYLGSPFQCDCGYIPAISHSSKDNCIEYLKKQVEECR